MSRPLTLAIAALVPLMAASLAVGAADVDLRAVAHDPQAALVLMQSRLPRTLAVVLTGAALSLAVIRRLPVREMMLVPITGLVLSGILGVGVSFVAWQAELTQQISVWLGSGEFSGVIAGRYELLWLGAAAAALAWLAADRFAILALGDDVATGLGLNTRAVMRLGLVVVVAVVTATVVATVGMIPFLGLVVPNITARIMGDDLRASLPVVAGLGAALLLACDLAARLVVRPYELPVGMILGVVGAALFLTLLYMRPARG